MAKTDRPDELTSYVAFQRAVAECLEEAARLAIALQPHLIFRTAVERAVSK
jgi:hypothetical protein